MATKTKTTTQLKQSPNAQGRVRKLTRRNKKRIVRTSSKVPNSFVLLGRSVQHLWHHKKLFGGIFVIYLVLYIVLVKGIASNFQLSETRTLIEEAVGNDLGSVFTGFALMGALLGSAGTTISESANVYQLMLFVLFSLAIIWALRHTFEAKTSSAKIRHAFYQGMYPLIPFLLVGLVILLQLVPALVGLTIYGVLSANGLMVGILENIVAIFITGLLVFLSIYLVSSSAFASYIVTLENMTPMKALRSARKVVRYRRWSILRKVVFLPFVAAVFLIAIFFPLVLLAPVVAEILFLLCSIGIIFVAHTYMYMLYRELL